mgnify:FL=1
MDLNKFTKHVTQWFAPLSPKFNYRYVVIGLDNDYAKKYYKAVFCENLMDVKAVEYGMYTQGIRYISRYKIEDLDRFPRNTHGLSVVGLPFYAHIYWEIGMKEHILRTSANTQARAHIKNVMSKLGKA